MKTIKEHIKTNQYKPAYLLYGTEDYLKKSYQVKLKDGILGTGDEMNYTYFEGKGIEVERIVESAQTLPFFAEHRLIVIKNSGFFKNQNNLADYIRDFPDTTVLVFVEQEVDKRNRLFKAVKEIGVVSEMTEMDEKNLKMWIAAQLQRAGKKVTENTVSFLLNQVGTSMNILTNELEKLICFAMDREVITIEDIEEVCTVQITGKIFAMVDSIASGNQDQALKLYYDLLTLREKPLSILFLITRHFNILLQVKELADNGYNGSVIAQKVSVPPFAVNKYITQSKNFTMGRLKEALETCATIEEEIKTGRMNEIMGVEILIVTYSKKI